jgi:hypothetical protein
VDLVANGLDLKQLVTDETVGAREVREREVAVAGALEEDLLRAGHLIAVRRRSADTTVVRIVEELSTHLRYTGNTTHGTTPMIGA